MVACQSTPQQGFCSIAQSLDKSQYLESIKARIVGLSGRYRFPDDAEFGHGLKTNYLYGTRALKFMLRRLENQGRKEPVLVTDYTIGSTSPLANKDLSEPHCA